MWFKTIGSLSLGASLSHARALTLPLSLSLALSLSLCPLLAQVNRFDAFLKQNDTDAVEAMRKAEAQTKLKVGALQTPTD